MVLEGVWKDGRLLRDETEVDGDHDVDRLRNGRVREDAARRQDADRPVRRGKDRRRDSPEHHAEAVRRCPEVAEAMKGEGCKCNEDSENEMELCHRVCEVSQRNGVEATGITLAHMQGLGIGTAQSFI